MYVWWQAARFDGRQSKKFIKWRKQNRWTVDEARNQRNQVQKANCKQKDYETTLYCEEFSWEQIDSILNKEPK